MVDEFMHQGGITTALGQITQCKKFKPNRLLFEYLAELAILCEHLGRVQNIVLQRKKKGYIICEEELSLNWLHWDFFLTLFPWTELRQRLFLRMNSLTYKELNACWKLQRLKEYSLLLFKDSQTFHAFKNMLQITYVP